MLYLIIFLLIFWGVVRYDIYQKKDKNDIFYRFLLFVLIIVSGLAYRMGGDCMNYISEYNLYPLNESFSLSNLTSYNGRQPGWVLLCKLCRLVTTDFSFFKIIHSIIYNTLIFVSIKHLTKYRFSMILFYFVLLYFDTNFQILRQSLAIGLFLYSIYYFKCQKWIKYYLCIALAILFHESALICLLFPLIRKVQVNKKVIFLCILMVLCIIIFRDAVVDILVSLMMSNFEDKGFVYVNEIESQNTFTMYSNIFLSILVPLFYIYKIRKTNLNTVTYKGAICYGLLYTINLFFPIFYRFSYYFIFFFYLLYIDMFYSISKLFITSLKFKKYNVYQVKKYYLACMIFFFVVFLSIKSRFYFVEYADTGIPTWVQYYPYSSIIFKDKDPMRERFISRLPN